jgi:hypothetical protein
MANFAEFFVQTLMLSFEGVYESMLFSYEHPVLVSSVLASYIYICRAYGPNNDKSSGSDGKSLQEFSKEFADKLPHDIADKLSQIGALERKVAFKDDGCIVD